MIRHHYDIVRAVEKGDGSAADAAIQADIKAAAKFFETSGIWAEATSRRLTDFVDAAGEDRTTVCGPMSQKISTSGSRLSSELHSHSAHPRSALLMSTASPVNGRTTDARSKYVRPHCQTCNQAASSKRIDCAPFHRTVVPRACRFSRPDVSVMKWFPASCPIFEANETPP